MTQCDGLGQILVEAQGLGDGAADLGDLQGVAQARAQVVLARGDEYLRLVCQASEGAAGGRDSSQRRSPLPYGGRSFSPAAGIRPGIAADRPPPDDRQV